MKKKPIKLTLVEKFPLFITSLFKRETPILARVLIFATFLYVLLPTDLLPDFLGPLGFMDDALLLPLMVNSVVKRLPEHMLQQAIKAN
ncbi:YkvA family protein [Facklamia sp. P12945]|uniref:YkvA family protein n=1 Tax=unclassified Facklamia TaxID=2622293 RepID=UPI003D181264